jgi:serine/threonine protein kinase
VISLAIRNQQEAQQLGDAMLNEIRMIKKLRKASNHIINLYDFDFHPNTGLAFMVMERGEQDLEKALQQHGHLSPPVRKQLWLQLVNIAFTLHNRGIVSIYLRVRSFLSCSCL